MKPTVVFSNYDDLRNPFYGGGGAGAIHEIAKRLLPRYQVRVLTGHYPGSRDELRDGVRYERVGPRFQSPKLGQLAFHFALPGLARKTSFDLWVESLTPPFSTACLQLFTKKPVSLLTQNLPGLAMARKYKLPFHWVEHWGLKTYRSGIALSETIRQDLLRANPQMQVAVIPNGVDPALIDPPVDNQGQYILFLGRLDIRQKGLDLLLEAFHQVAAQCSVPLVIAGSGLPHEEAALRQQIAQRGLNSQVRLLGKVTGAQKAEVFRQAMFLVMPSRFEGFPLTLLEACCWQLPVVLFAIPELAWLPSSCCWQLPPFDSQALAQALLSLTRDPARRQAMGQAAKAWVRPFGWDALAAEYDKFFASLLAPC